MIVNDEILFYLLLAISVLPFLVALSNLIFTNPLPTVSENLAEEYFGTFVSILIPARNEGNGISKCLESLISQNHVNFEVLVLDDMSTDRTAEIVQGFADSDLRIRMIQGLELPSGWVGKHWSCEQLSKEAVGELLLFVDADTILSPDAISAALIEFQRSNSDLLSVIPRRIVSSVSEWLMYPFMDWVLFSWMPIKLASKIQNSHISAAFGQFMLFRRGAYQMIGGHAAISSNPIDDFSLGRAIKKRGLKLQLLEGTKCVSILPYAGNSKALIGVSRSIFPAINYRISVFLVFSFILLMVGFLPTITLVIKATSIPQQWNLIFVSVSSLGMIMGSWFISCLKFKHNYLTVMLYPISILLMVLVGFHSAFTYLFRTTNWKGRRIVGQRIRL